MNDTDSFTANILPRVSPFFVDFTQTQTYTATNKNGGTYEKKKILVSSPSLSNPIVVEISKRDYDTLRILALSGIKTFSATEGTANVNGFRPLIIGGTPVMGEGKK